MKELRGTGVALVTPFTGEGQIDVPALTRLVEHCVSGGVDYLVVLGTTAENVTLGNAEKKLVTDTVVKVNAGRLPVVLGLGGNNTRALCEALLQLDPGPFTAILSVSPYYNRPTQEGIYRHFKEIAAVSPLPIVLYNVPGRTGSNMEVETTLRLARELPNVVAIKEASGDMAQTLRLIAQRPPGFLVLSGEDMLALPTVTAGGDGVISVLGQAFPSRFSEMIRLGANGGTSEAYARHYELQSAMELIFQEGNPAGIKALLEQLGICRAHVRLPLVEASESLKKKLLACNQALTPVALNKSF
ncbi:4-hydroxy-tetrahydrodipicolinate synthase [Maribacter sp. 2307ULW6-5]|uniref:4-hydroxy-tetrahydrodipicolinate synthase n=1 Tax=Maribacter sp. 2307ULW6-5 TaxID=3386275 RepID=UPI0039BD606E